MTIREVEDDRLNEPHANRGLMTIDTIIRAGLKALRERDLGGFEESVREFLAWGQDEGEVFKEYLLGVYLLSIDDPYEGWKELSHQISKAWPEDVSAVQAIREQRT